MLARQTLRAVQPLKANIRRYATEGSTGSASNTALLAGLGVAAAGGGYYYYYYYYSSSEKPAAAESGAPPSKDEQHTIPSSTTKSAAFTGGDQGFVSLRLDSVEEINHNTKKFRYELPNKDDISGLQIASAVISKYKGPEMEKPVIRPYTPVSDEDQSGFIDFVVKRYPNGPMSEHMHHMKPDQRLDFKGPIPKYPWQPNKHDHIALIAGGTGITPMYQLIRAIFKNSQDRTKVTLIYGNLTEDDIILKHELADLENQYPQRFRAFYTLDKPPDGWTQGKGHVTKELLKTVLPEPKVENIKVFVCGPPGMYKAISGPKKSPQDQGELTGMLKDLGYAQDQVYKF